MDRQQNTHSTRPPLRERQREQTRQLLLDAAREAFEERGYHVTIEEIARRAGTSRGTFYLYWSKRNALAALLAELIDDQDAPLFGGINEQTPITVDKLARWIAATLEKWQRHRLLARAWSEGDLQDPEISAITDAHAERRTSRFAEMILRARAAAGLPRDLADARARASLMHLQLHAVASHVAVRGAELDLDRTVRAMAEQWYMAIHADHGAGGARELAA